MRREIVTVRAFGRQPLVRRVWVTVDQCVCISSEDEFQKLMSGEESLTPVGFPLDDIFRFDPERADMAENNYHPDQWDWNALTPWEESSDR